jgi:pimeloyl-ACP methyl ester carboxylesterase
MFSVQISKAGRALRRSWRRVAPAGRRFPTPRGPRRWAVVTAAAALAAATLPGGVVAAEPATRPPALHWRSCQDPVFVRLQCASIEVPLDYARPAGRKISIKVSRMRARGGSRDGALLVNPGGPGASGIAMAGDVASRLPKNVARDVIGFDPRGVGASRPAMTCSPRFFDPVRPDYVPSTGRAERAWLKRVRGYAAACARKYGWLLPHMNTANVARDMDRIRAALGRTKIGFFGYSYGTYLGAVYGQYFPKRVDRLVLDSVVNPSQVWYGANVGQSHAFDARIKDFFHWIARHEAAYGLGSTAAAVEANWYRLRKALGRKPAGGRVGSSELDDTFMAAGYDSSTWPSLASALSSRVNRRSSRKLTAAFNDMGRVGREGENGYAVYTAVGCRDAPWPRDWARWRRDTVRTRKRAPFLAWNNTWYNAPCAFWPVPASGAVRIGGASLPPTLLVQAERDAATPRAGADEMRRLLPSARLLLEAGGGDHGVSLSGNRCIDRHVFRYLDDGRLPGANPKKRPGANPGAPAGAMPIAKPGGRPRTAAGPAPRTATRPEAKADASCPAPSRPRSSHGSGGNTGRAVTRCLTRLPYAGVVVHGNCR